jgi:DNA-directed RNA polymerase II subunit RPB2
MSGITEADQMNIVLSYIEQIGPVSHQLESFNNLINFGFQKIIDETPDIAIDVSEDEKYVVKFGQVYIDNPCIIEEDRLINYITPQEARNRDMFYESQISVDIIEETYIKGELETGKYNTKIALGRVPIMLRSCKCNLYNKTYEEIISAGECENDYGGYFIINGKERVLVSQERINYNHVYVFNQKLASKWKYIAEIRSMSDETGHSVLVKAQVDAECKNVVFSLPYVGEEIPAAVVFKALGFLEDKEILKFIGDDERLYPIMKSMFRNSKKWKTQEDALNYIGNFSLHVIPKERRVSYAEQVLDNEIFPHLGVSTKFEKALLLGHMLRKLLYTFLEIRPEDDRDNISLKRIETAGVLIGDLFRMLMKRLIENAKKYLVKRQDIVTVLSRLNIITTGIRHCFSTGNWGIQKNTYVRTGVSQILSRLSYSAFVSHLRRVIIPIGKEGKNTKIRQLHPSQIYFICPSETPEGHSVGIVKNLALLSKITLGTPHIIAKEVIERAIDFTKTSDASIDDIGTYTKIFLNGTIIGYSDLPREFVKNFKNIRSQGLINKDVGICYDDIDNEVLIFTDEGRFIRPLLTVDDEELKIKDYKGETWDELIENNHITYVDSNEIEASVIATTPEEVKSTGYDYCEIHPSTMLGVCVGSIPFPEHSQAPRNCYSSSQMKQALGSFALSMKNRTDTVVHYMHYPQKPLVKTHYNAALKFDDMPSGVNCVVAVLCTTGFNQEDSVIINKSAIQRGMFVTTVSKTFSIEEKKKSGSSFETIEIPPLDVRNKTFNYNKLDLDGIIPEGYPVFKGDVLVGKTLTKVSKDDETEQTDCSLVVKSGEEGIVDKVFITTKAEGYRIIKIRIRQMRIPEVGDKFATREGQKGTCGMVYNQEDLPFTSDGMVPDVIINPHAFPSRMTINQLIESILGKKCALKGECGYATPFTSHSDNPIDNISEELKSYGFERFGNDDMYNGMTGEPIRAKVFMGITFYQRLKHLVMDKIHARSFGNVTVLSRQPLEGRSREGGLRCGEMERDALISHGVSGFLKERLFTMSDPYKIVVCDKCGAVYSNPDGCKNCRNDKFVSVNIPYACKLLLQELNAMNIKTTIIPK